MENRCAGKGDALFSYYPFVEKTTSGGVGRAKGNRTLAKRP